MPRPLPFLLVSAVLLAGQDSSGKMPAHAAVPRHPVEAAWPVGNWNVEFANGVKEVCDVFTYDGEGHAIVDEPLRRSRGLVASHGPSFVLTFNDNRVERWTPVGARYIVEHWFPGSEMLTATPVLGIADRTP